MAYLTPFQAEDENDAEQLDALDFSNQADPAEPELPPDDLPDEQDDATEELSARSKGPALDFSRFADPVPAPRAAKPARGKAPLDFSSQADIAEPPLAKVPLPRARPAQAQGDLFSNVPIPQARPDIGSPAPADYAAPLEDTGRFRDIYGSQKGMLTGDEAYEEYQGKLKSAEAAVADAETRLNGIKERAAAIPDLRTARKRGSAAETQRLAIEAELENAQKALDVARSGLAEVQRSSPPTVGKLRDALTRAATSAITGPMDIIGGAARPLDAALDATLGTDTGIAEAMRKGSEQVMREGATDPTRDKEFAAQLGAGAGSSLVFVLTGFAGRALGATAGASAGAAGGLQQAEQNYREADRLGVPAYKKALAYLAGGGIGATEGMIGLGRMPDVLAKMDAATGGGVKRYFGLVAREMGEEGVQNGLQQLLQNVADYGILGKDPGDITKDVWEQALIGAVVGMGFTGVVGSPALLGGKEAERAIPQPAAAMPTPEEIERRARGEADAAPVQPQTQQPAAAARQPSEESPAPQPAVSATERRVLRKKGYLDDQIDGMSRAEAEQELGEAAEQGIEAEPEAAAAQAPPAPAAIAPDQPTAEPASDIEAQALDLKDKTSDRNAVWLPRATVEHLRNVGKLDDVLKAGVPMENFDGAGGILVAKNQKIARTARKLHTQKVSLQAIIGGLTGSGTGKPADAQTVVQQTNQAGNVTQESAVSPGEGPAVAATMAEPGRQVVEKPVTEAIAERAAKVVADEQAADFSSQAAPAEGAGTRQSPAKVNDALDVARAEQRVNTEPTEAQKEAGNYKKGHVRWGGLDITIENPKGSTRSGTDRTGKPWQVEMPAAYGYVKRSKGKDGDQVDVYLGPQHDAAQAFVVDQIDPATGKYDEAKVILGVNSQDAARKLYESAFSDGSGASRIGAITEWPLARLKKWLSSNRTTRPIAYRENQGGRQTARVQQDTIIQGVAQRGGPLPQPEQSGLSQLRSPGDQATPGVGEQLSGISGGRGTSTISEAYVGKDRQQQGVRTGQRPLGDEEGAGAKHAQEPLPDVSRKNTDADRLGRGNGVGAIDATLPSGTGQNDGGRGTIDQPARRSKAGGVGSLDFSAQGEPVTAPPAAPKAKHQPKKPKGPSYLDRLENYFRVGRIYKAYMGFDKVLGFERLPDGGWQVLVQEIKNGEKVGEPRTHATAPSKKDLEAWEKQHPVPARAETDETTKAPEAGPFDSEAKPTETPASKLADRFIATGNLLAAYAWLNRQGRIINYTDEEGHLRQGILTAKDFDVAEHFRHKAKAVRDPAEVVAWVKNNPGKPMYSEDDVVRLDLSNGRFFITTEAAKRTGGVYYLDKKLTELVGNNFYKRGPMVAEMWKPSDKDMTAVVKRLQELGAVFVDRTQTTLPPVEKIAPPKDDEAKASIERPSGYTPTAERKRKLIERAVFDAVAQVAGIDAARRTAAVEAVQENSRPGWNVGEDNSDFEATAAYFPRRETSGVNPLIMVSLASRDAVKAAYHEGWHAIEGTLVPDEVLILERETPRLRDFVARQNPGIAGPIRGAEQEEVWAESAALYTVMRERGEPIGGIHIAARRIFEKIRNLLTRIKNALDGLGFKSASDIFEDFARGEMATRRASLAPEDRRRWWKAGEAPRASIRRRRPTEDDLLPPPETVREAWDPNVPFKQRLSDAVDALLLNPARTFWDRQIDLLRFQKASEAMGRRVSESLDTYLAATLYPGKVGERMKDQIKVLWEPLYDAMAERGVGRDELHDYLYARHAPERNAEIRKIDPDNNAGSGMTDEEAAEVLGALEHRRADFEAVAALIDKIVEANRDIMLKEGLESELTIEQWERTYAHYVPLKGWESGNEDLVGNIGSPSTGAGFDVRRSESERALGRASRADDILTNLLDQTQRTIIRAEKNRVAKTFLRFAQGNPSPFYKIGLAEKKRGINPLTGLVEEYWTSLPTHLDRVFAVKVGGKTTYIEVMHEGLLEALKSLGADKMNFFLRVMGRLTREYSRFQTAKNPEFVFTNILRDIQDAGFTISAEQQARYTRTFFKNLLNGRALFGAVLGTADKGADSSYRRWYDEWREAGGKISHYGLKDLDELRGEFERELNQRTESTGKTAAMAMPRFFNPINGKFVKFLEALSDVTESTTRLAVYISGREIGLSKAQAARMARNATVDFNRRGIHSTPINALYAFANANIQGNVRLLRVLRKSKIARRAALGLVVAGMLMTYWNMSVSPEDEDKKRAYEKRKYWERERNIIIYWPGSKQAAKIPLGYGLNVFWMMGEQLAMRMLGKVSSREAIANVLGTTVSAFNPLGTQGSWFDWETWVKAYTPSVVRFVPEIGFNSNFAGTKIHPEEMPWTEGLPHSSQHKAFTHPAAVATAEFANRLTGGNKYQPGWLSPYPDDLEYGWNFAVGGLGRFIANTSGTINDMVDGVDRPVERIPFVRRFVVSDNSPSVQSNAYYEKRREEQVKARQLRAAIKARREGTDDGSADQVIEKLAPEVGARPSKSGKGVAVRTEEVFRNADKQIKALRQQQDAIRKDQKIIRAERETRIRELQAQMREIMGRARSQTAPAN